jgi:hypothetical protein
VRTAVKQETIRSRYKRTVPINRGESENYSNCENNHKRAPVSSCRAGDWITVVPHASRNGEKAPIALKKLEVWRGFRCAGGVEAE